MDNFRFQSKCKTQPQDLYNSRLTTRERSAVLSHARDFVWRVEDEKLLTEPYSGQHPWNVIAVCWWRGNIYGFDALTLEPWGEFGVPDSVLPKVQRTIDYFKPQFEALSAKGRILKRL